MDNEEHTRGDLKHISEKAYFGIEELKLDVCALVLRAAQLDKIKGSLNRICLDLQTRGDMTLQEWSEIADHPERQAAYLECYLRGE